MNWEHLTLIIWLRWRLSYNQWRRAGKLNLVLTVMLVVGALISAVLAFFVALIAGCWLLPRAEPGHMLIMWDLIVVSFLFLWSMGVVTELQRSEFLALDKMLHFPISPTGAFLLNYLSSLVSLAIVLFLPAMMGLCIASVVAHGPAMLLLFPLAFGFVLVVSAVTYQFRGWMATLMQDKRRRRTIVTLVTILFILITQVPNLAHLALRQQRSSARKAEVAAKTGLAKEPAAGAIEQDVGDERRQIDRRWEAMIDNLAIANLVVPVGWLPYGALAAATGNPWPGLLGSLGLILMGMASLWRSHRATLRMYTGQSRAVRPRGVARKGSPRIMAAPFLERTVPGCSGPVSAIVFIGLRNMLRAPEAKMALISPIILLVIFGSMLFLGPLRDMPAEARPFLAIVAIGVTMLGIMQLTINVFGHDRGGFRAFVLMPVARRDILLGKNLALAPFACILVTMVLGAMQIVVPLKMMHLVATLVQFVPAYLLACLVGNATSIFAPMAVSAGSLKPVQPKFWPILVHMLSTMTTPVLLVPALGALGIELLLDKFAGGRWFPLYLIISIVELPIAVVLYRFLLIRQGQLLQSREARILEIVTGNVE